MCGAKPLKWFLQTIVSILIVAILVIIPFQPVQAQQLRILIGLIPEMNVFKQKERFRSLGEYLAQKIGTRVEFTILSRYGNIIERFKAEKMDGAFFGSFTGALAIQKLGVVPWQGPSISTTCPPIMAASSSGRTAPSEAPRI